MSAARCRRLALAAPVLALATAAVVAWRLRNWGATREEQAAVLPGDELVPGPADVTTRAVAVDAPADVVWPWLVQIGRDRGGLYSYDWLENVFGLDVHSAGEIHDEWQDLRVGDRVELVPDGWLGLRGGYALPVARVEPGRALVLRLPPDEGPWDAVWSFVLVPDGPDRCRLLSRGRTACQPGFRGLAARLAGAMTDPVTLVMTRRMLLGVKERAEGFDLDAALCRVA